MENKNAVLPSVSCEMSRERTKGRSLHEPSKPAHKVAGQKWNMANAEACSGATVSQYEQNPVSGCQCLAGMFVLSTVAEGLTVLASYRLLL